MDDGDEEMESEKKVADVVVVAPPFERTERDGMLLQVVVTNASVPWNRIFVHVHDSKKENQ